MLQLSHKSRILADTAATDYAREGKTPANLSPKNRTPATTTPMDPTSQPPTSSQQDDALGANVRVLFQFLQMTLQQ